MKKSRADFVPVLITLTAVAVWLAAAPPAAAQGPSSVGSAAPATAAPLPVVPSDYLIGAGDLLSVVFWRDKDISGDVIVRPDGKISLPLIHDVAASGLTPEQLRARLIEAATQYLEDPDAAVIVREIRSRNVYITGNVSKPGTYPLPGSLNVLQCLAMAGGLLEYADDKNIVVIRNDKEGRSEYYKFNYDDVVKQKHTEQNIALKPGDTIVVR